MANEYSNRIQYALNELTYKEDSAPPNPKYLVLLNPFGGAGAARRNWSLIEPMFKVAAIEYELRETQYAGHAGDIVREQITPGQWDVIVTVSGDGLIHEIINGLMQRSDWDKEVEVAGRGTVKFKDIITIGAIPGGTGNGLVKSLLHRGGEEYGIEPAAFRVLKNRAIPIDLTELTLEYQPDHKVYSFLSFAWSIFADIDIGSEAIRCCGPTRFTLWGVLRTLIMRDYHGSLRYEGED